ncbi:D-alanine--D-alanine ligase family protein [Roseateles sp. DB2]|uniref:D-alanine--D-alanine ligase family protein n=1 Tax=Roseateles sp. DB2 TaxID=3453717 RepID=UPI003EEC4863
MEPNRTPRVPASKQADRPATTVGLFFGGRSAEHAVSIRSAATIHAALCNAGYQVVPIGIELGGSWRYMPLTQDTFHQEVDARACAVTLAPGSAGQLIARDGLPVAGGLPRIDVAFPALHGPFGEDGCLQGLFETCGLPYVGAKVLAGAITMDKEVTKRLLSAAGLPVVPYRVQFAGQPTPAWQSVSEQLGPRLYVKPASLGSSIGTAPADDPASFAQALAGALEHGEKVLIETRIVGRELECGVLETGDEPVASVVGEIKAGTQDAFYDYAAKYAADSPATTEVPARLPAEISDRVRAMAVEAFRTLSCSGLARVDFFLSEQGELFINEVNTLPGFTSISLFPCMFEASGISIQDQVTQLVQRAMGRR